MNNFEIKVLDTVKHYNMLENGDSVLVGLSGGADSCSLLYVLKVLAETIGIKLYCAHLNHGIRGDEAQRDMNFAKKFAAELDVPIVCETFDVPKYAKEYKLYLPDKKLLHKVSFSLIPGTNKFLVFFSPHSAV